MTWDQSAAAGLRVAWCWRARAGAQKCWLDRSRVVVWGSVPAYGSASRLRQGNHFCVHALVKEFEVLRLLELEGT